MIERRVLQIAERSFDFEDRVHVTLVVTCLGLFVMPVL